MDNFIVVSDKDIPEIRRYMELFDVSGHLVIVNCFGGPHILSKTYALVTTSLDSDRMEALLTLGLFSSVSVPYPCPKDYDSLSKTDNTQHIVS